MKTFFSVLILFELILMIYLGVTFEGGEGAQSWTFLLHRFLWGNFLGLPPLLLLLFFLFSLKKRNS